MQHGGNLIGIEVWPGAGKVKDRTEIVEFTGLELEDEGSKVPRKYT